MTIKMKGAESYWAVIRTIYLAPVIYASNASLNVIWIAFNFYPINQRFLEVLFNFRFGGLSLFDKEHLGTYVKYT